MRWCHTLLAKKQHSFIDKDSSQPAAEGIFMFEPRNVIGGCPQAVLHGLLVITDHAVRDHRKSATVSAPTGAFNVLRV
jgi:hypothetical protein